MIHFTVNGKECCCEVDSDIPLLWFLRETIGLTGTKYCCGKGLCGACTVLVDGSPIRSCQTPLSHLPGKHIVTIEGLSNHVLHPLQKAWIEENAVQCGYCQSGQIMAAAALLQEKRIPTDADIDSAMSGILCRCGSYQQIRRAIHRAAELIGAGAD